MKGKRKVMAADRTPVIQLGTIPLGITVFITGMAIMVLELMGSRVIGPYYGVSLYVWASLIATAMIALAIGYWIGGRIADAKAHPDYLYGSILIAAFLAVAIPAIRRPIILLSAPMGVRMGSLTSAMMLFLLPITALGFVSPYAVKLHARTLNRVGSSAGTLYALSTMGSVVGTLLTGFILIPSLAMDTILYALGALLAVVSALYWMKRKKPSLMAASAVILLFVGTMGTSAGRPPAGLLRKGYRLVFSKETPYGQLKVVDVGEGRYMLVNGSFQGEVDLATGQTRSGYLHLMDAACREYIPHAERALIVGLGAGFLPSMFSGRGLLVDSVEIDETVIHAARRFFGFRPGRGEVIQADGRYYLETTDQHYDGIFLDVFSSESAPAHLLSLEVFQRCAKLLSERGLLCINFLGFRQGPHARVVHAILRTLREVFPHTCVWWFSYPGEGNEFGNFVFLASHAELPPRDLGARIREAGALSERSIAEMSRLPMQDIGPGPIITDTYNPLFAWNSEADLKIRRGILRYLPSELLLG